MVLQEGSELVHRGSMVRLPLRRSSHGVAEKGREGGVEGELGVEERGEDLESGISLRGA